MQQILSFNIFCYYILEIQSKNRVSCRFGAFSNASSTIRAIFEALYIFPFPKLSLIFCILKRLARNKATFHRSLGRFFMLCEHGFTKKNSCNEVNIIFRSAAF